MLFPAHEIFFYLETRKTLAYDANMWPWRTLAYAVVLGKSTRLHQLFFDDPVGVLVAIGGAPPVVPREKVVKIADRTKNG